MAFVEFDIVGTNYLPQGKKTWLSSRQSERGKIILSVSHNDGQRERQRERER